MLALTHLNGFNTTQGLQWTFTDTAQNQSNLTTYTFSSVSFGYSTNDRLIVVLVDSARTGASNLSSATIGGVSATVYSAVGNNTTSAIAYAVVPSGSTGDVVLTFASQQARAAIGVIAVYGVESSAYDLQSSSGGSDTSRSITISVVANSITFANANSGGAASTWTNATEFADGTFSESGNYTWAYYYGEGSASRTITYGNCRILTGCTFRSYEATI